MKIKSSKLLKVCSVLAALVFFLTALLFPVKAFAASADGSGPNPGPGSEDPGPQALIYYFSDSEWGSIVANHIWSKTPRTVNFTPFNPGNSAEEQIQALINLINYHGITTIEGSYVIFEFETPFAIDSNDTRDRVPDILYSIFSTLKANDCFVMFICGTDEYLFRNNNAFLDSVDIHVNTDKLSSFFMSIFYWAAHDCGKMQIEKCVFFLDQCVAPFNGLQTRECWFVRFFFVRYIKSVYMDEIKNGGSYVENVLKDNSIRILSHVYDDTYFDLVYGDYVDISSGEILDELEHVYAVGMNTGEQWYSEDWITEIQDISLEKGRDLTVFYYEECEEYDLWEGWTLPSDYGTLYATRGVTRSYLEKIMLNFVAGNDMHAYDNWSGRCDITHKVGILVGIGDDVVGSGGEWLVDMMGGGDFHVPGWDLFLTGESDGGTGDADYFNDDSNVWLSNLNCE